MMLENEVVMLQNEIEEKNFINLIYELDEFSERDIIQLYISKNKGINYNIGKLRDYLYNLCDIGTLKYNGAFFKVIPTTERLSYRKFFTRVVV